MTGFNQTKDAGARAFLNRTLKWDTVLLGIVSLLLFTGCVSTSRPKATPSSPARPASPPPETPGLPTSPTPAQKEGPMIGMASYYGKKYHGRKTASGEIYDMNKMTAAHRTLPFGVTVRVTDLSSNRSVIVRINDRGPFARGRVIDLSLAAAKRLGIIQSGQAEVRIDLWSETKAAAAEPSAPDEICDETIRLSANSE